MIFIKAERILILHPMTNIGLGLMGVLDNLQHLTILPNLFSLFICPLVSLYMKHDLTGAFIYF